MTTAQAEKLEFKTELKQLLHLITHSLYSNKEIFLRELISNASDAINKIKFDSLQHDELLEDNKDWKIKIGLDKDAGTLTVSDNGVGMSLAEAIENLGTIAKSGTRAFLENLKKAEAKERPDLIGQFGVGFYSAFMVADKVTVVSRPAGDPEHGVHWESDGQGEFTVDAARKETRGTEVTLHLKADEKEFLDPWRVRQIVRKFSDFIEHPVVMDVEKEEEEGKKTIVEETLNSRKAIWLRSKSEVTDEEYAEFYKQISGDADKPAKVIHYVAEGTNEFRVLLFIPAHRPLAFEWGEVPIGPRLYIQRVLIMDHCEELLPPYLRFVCGVVDSSDLPLNISREMLQHNPLLEKMRKNLVKAVLKALDDMKTDETEKYAQFFAGLGPVLKEGVGRDHANREKIADLLLFESMKTEKGKHTTLPEYVAKMGGTQKDVWLSHRRGARTAGAFAVSGGLPRPRLGRAAADRSGGRVHDGFAAHLQGQAAQGGRPRRTRRREGREEDRCRTVRGFVRDTESEAAGGGGRAAVITAEGECRLSGSRRTRDDGAPGAVDAAHGPRRRDGCVEARAGAERRASGGGSPTQTP